MDCLWRACAMMGAAIGVIVAACGSDTTTERVASSSVSSSSSQSSGGSTSVSSTASGVGGCEAQCESMYGAGRDELDALESCICCKACFTLCEPEGYCPSGGREGGCSTMFSDCAACAYSSCSWDID